MVTGAARGLGRAYTLEVCRQGAAVVANDVDEAALKEVAAPSGMCQAACTPSRAISPILTPRLDDDDLRLLLDLHLTAAFRLLRAIGGYWRAEAKAARAIDAAVVLTTSSADLYGFRAEAAYSAAKAAVAMLARVGADELGRSGTTVNAIAPVARTRLTGWLGDRAAEPADDPLPAEHVAPVVAWLLGPGARDVTGRVLEAGNGQISVPDTWQPGARFALPPLRSPDAADALLPRVLASATRPSALLYPG